MADRLGNVRQGAVGIASMRDWIADWKRWTRSERVLAVVVAGLMMALPVGYLLAPHV